MTQAFHSSRSAGLQTLVGVGSLAVAALLAAGAVGISSDAGYSGVGPNFMPWLISAALAVCGVMLVWEARTGGFRELEPGSGAGRGHWAGFVWISAGLLLNAALITTIGFIPSCVLCFVLAVRGFKSGEGTLDLGLRALLIDILVGAAIAAPVYWMFTKLLAVSLPGLTQTGWL